MKDIVIEVFYGRGLNKKKSMFRLIKREDGRFEIRRDNYSLLLYLEEKKAVEGFRALKEKRS